MTEILATQPAEHLPPEGFVIGMPGEHGFYVPTDLREQIALQQASIKARDRIKPPKLQTQVNDMQDGRTLVGDYPNALSQATIESRNDLLETPVAEFQTTVDRDNVNSSYAAELTSVYDYFQGKGLPIDPLRVVSKEVAKKAYAIAGQDPSEAEVNLGQHLNGRALVIEDKANIETFGPNYIIGIGLHEAAHSLHSHERMLRTVTETSDRSLRIGGVATSGLVKADLRREAKTSMSGHFWSEAFADLTRVKALREMGRSNDISEDSEDISVGDATITVRPNAAGNAQHVAGTESITMPAEYTMVVVTPPEGKKTVATIAANYAAYALDLLDSRAPGLYDDFLGAARDPRRQADAIRKIEGIQPGLYRKLADLEYTENDFVAGLGLVIGGLEASPPTAK